MEADQKEEKQDSIQTNLQEHLVALVESSNDAIISNTIEGIITYWNNGAEEIFGYSQDEVLGKSINILVPDKTDVKKEIFDKYNFGEKSEYYETKKVKKDGSIIDVSVTVSSILDSEKKIIGFSTIARDITNRIESNNLFKTLFESAPDAFIITDGNGKIKLLNAQSEKLFGYKIEEIVGKEVEILIPSRFKSDHLKHMKKFISDPKTRPMGLGLNLFGKNKEGKEFPVDISLSPIKIEGELLISASIRDLSAITIIAVQEKNKAEAINKTLTALNQELEAFIYVASHDLQEPQRMVNSYLQLLEKKYADKLDQNAREYINYAIEGSNRMRTLILSLLDYSRINKERLFEEIDLSLLLKEVINRLKPYITKSNPTIKIETLPSIWGDKLLISQLFENLLSNALKFRSEGTPEILVSCNKGKDEYVFSVKDNGIGIQKEYGGKLFAIFQRLNAKDRYPGAGMGLAICKKIVEKHGGKIWFDSEFGKGSTFYFTIKCKEEIKNSL